MGYSHVGYSLCSSIPIQGSRYTGVPVYRGAPIHGYCIYSNPLYRGVIIEQTPYIEVLHIQGTPYIGVSHICTSLVHSVSLSLAPGMLASSFCGVDCGADEGSSFYGVDDSFLLCG